MTTRLAYAFLPCFLLVACESDSGGGGQTGTGTGTLLVTASAVGFAELPNQTEPSDFHTAFNVSVFRADGSPVVPVDDATVTITSPEGEVVLQFTQDGSYWGEQDGYWKEYSLDVRAGEHYVAGVAVTGPAIHRITSPENGAMVPAETDLEVTWDQQHAAGAVVRSSFMPAGETSVDDSGSYTLAGELLVITGDGQGYDRLQIERANSVTPAGAAQQSFFTVSVTNGVTYSLTPR
jgi:hypothetical protein